MDNNVSVVEYQGKKIILIGTAHVSQQSAELVKNIIDEEKPDSICVELDEARYQNLQNPKAWENTDVFQIIKSKRVAFLLANLILGSFQKKIAGQLGTVVGQEMIQGIESARETGANLVLADRDIRTTFMRIWRKLSLWAKMKLLFSMTYSFSEELVVSTDEVEELLKEGAAETLIEEMRKDFPVIGEVLIDERDQYLSHKIKNAPGNTVVAILGAAHIPGVKKAIFTTPDIARITHVPKGNPIYKYIGWVIPIAIIGLFIYGFVININTGWEQISVWVLWNSGLAALFTLLALGHPLSILTAGVTAPFTSINPFLACGWLAGLVQAWVKKPTVKDVKNLTQDITSFKGFFRNRFLKAFLVLIMANLGSSIGTFVAGTNIIRNLFQG